MASLSGDTPEETKLLVITINEGLLQVSNDVQLQALQACLGDHKDICGVVMAEQESSEIGRWDSAMANFGFSEKVVNARISTGEQISLCVYMRSLDRVRVIDSFSTGSVNHEKKKTHQKGGIIALLELHGIKICIGGFHLDGNLASLTERMAQLPSAVLRSQSRSTADVALFVGDMNCTLDPDKCPLDASAETPSAICAKLLAADIATLRATGEGNRLMELSADTKKMLEVALSTRECRSALMEAIDGMPEKLAVDLSSLSFDELWDQDKEPTEAMSGFGITELLLQGMPSGSLPTYRLANRDNKGFEALTSEKLRLGIQDPEMRLIKDTSELQGLQRLPAEMDVAVETIKECFFADPKAGVLKKRGELIRLNLGWLDRLYYGINSSSGSPSVDLKIEQGVPLVLRAGGSETLDHALIPWIVCMRSSNT